MDIGTSHLQLNSSLIPEDISKVVVPILGSRVESFSSRVGD